MKYHTILIALEIIYKGGVLVKLNPQSKENIIDIIYSSIFSKTKNTSLKDDFNKEGNENDSILDIYDEGSEDELDNNINYKKKYNLNFKHLEINIYCISSDESIIGNIRKLDEKKDSLDNSKSEKSLLKQNSYKDLYSSSNKKPTLTRKMTNIKFESDGESDFDDGEIENNSVKNLIETEDNQETYEGELLKDFYTLDDMEKNELYSNVIINQGLDEHTDIKNHIVICGMHPELIQFLLPLRSKNLPIKLIKWIIILTPNLPQEIHDTLSKFPRIIYIQGDPLQSDNLMRANIMTADIAIILGNYSNIDNNDNEACEIIGQDNEKKEKEKEENKNPNDHDDLMEDCKVVYIYKAIKRLNSSIQIITELLHMNNIELLLSTKSLKKLYKESKNMKNKNNSEQTQINDKNDDNSNLKYDLTPVYAAGEVYIPTVIDRITSQISYNSNLLTILNLILIGERPPEKKADKKLAQMVELTGSNLYLIQSESISEPYSDMFKRLLIKYNMISIALYRKSDQNDFYYVYTNPKKTTLVRKNDFIFILSSTENFISYYEKNIFLMNTERKLFPFDNEEVKNNINIINEEKDIIEDNSPKFTNIFKDAIEQQISKIKNNNINKENDGKIISLDNINNAFKNLFGNNKEIKKNKNEIKSGKYLEIDNMQKRLDKGMEKLKSLNEKCKNIKEDIEKFVKEEISSEFSVYLSNTITKNNNINQDMK